METMAQAYRTHRGNGILARLAGEAIKTKAEYAESYPGLPAEDFEDFYRAYRAGFNS